MSQNLAFNTPASGRSLRLTQEFDNLKNSPVMTVWFIKDSNLFQNVQAGVYLPFLDFSVFSAFKWLFRNTDKVC